MEFLFRNIVENCPAGNKVNEVTSQTLDHILVAVPTLIPHHHDQYLRELCRAAIIHARHIKLSFGDIGYFGDDAYFQEEGYISAYSDLAVSDTHTVAAAAFLGSTSYFQQLPSLTPGFSRRIAYLLAQLKMLLAKVTSN